MGLIADCVERALHGTGATTGSSTCSTTSTSTCCCSTSLRHIVARIFCQNNLAHFFQECNSSSTST